MKNIQVLKPFYRTEEILAHIKECCDIGWTGIGGKMVDFENAWKEYSGAKTCHMLNSATVGLQLAVLQLKMKYNWVEGESEIITTPLTFVSTNHAILYNNLVPIFADVDETGCLDPKEIEKKITDKTKAIMFVGLGGNSGKLKEVIKLAKEKNLKLILDAAHMSGSMWKDSRKQIGCDGEVDVVIFSGQAVKNLPTADSGWICWNGDDALEMDALTRKLSWLGIDKDTFSRTNSQGSYKWYYDVPFVGFKFHSNAIMGCFGLVGLKYLEKDNAYRRYLCEIYQDILKDVVEFVTVSEDCISSRHIIQILVDKRDEVMLALNQCGIFPGVHYRHNTLYTMYKMPEGSLPKAENFSEKTITLPLHMHLTVEDVKYVANKVKETLLKVF